MKTLSPKLSLWIPTAFVACLSTIVLIASQFEKGTPLPGSLIVLVCFLPCATMMIAQVTQRYISQLEARLAELERRTAPKDI
jgi:hypothetical protein